MPTLNVIEDSMAIRLHGQPFWATGIVLMNGVSEVTFRVCRPANKASRRQGGGDLPLVGGDLEKGFFVPLTTSCRPGNLTIPG